MSADVLTNELGRPATALRTIEPAQHTAAKACLPDI